MVIVLAIVPKVRGFISGRERWIFKVDKSPQHDLLRRRRKAVCATSKDFTAC
jgi:hypothetical protein